MDILYVTSPSFQLKEWSVKICTIILKEQLRVIVCDFFFSEINDLSGTPLFICVLAWQICFQIGFGFWHFVFLIKNNI